MTTRKMQQFLESLKIRWSLIVSFLQLRNELQLILSNYLKCWSCVYACICVRARETDRMNICGKCQQISQIIIIVAYGILQNMIPSVWCSQACKNKCQLTWQEYYELVWTIPNINVREKQGEWTIENKMKSMLYMFKKWCFAVGKS